MLKVNVSFVDSVAKSIILDTSTKQTRIKIMIKQSILAAALVLSSACSADDNLFSKPNPLTDSLRDLINAHVHWCVSQSKDGVDDAEARKLCLLRASELADETAWEWE